MKKIPKWLIIGGTIFILIVCGFIGGVVLGAVTSYCLDKNNIDWFRSTILDIF